MDVQHGDHGLNLNCPQSVGCKLKSHADLRQESPAAAIDEGLSGISANNESKQAKEVMTRRGLQASGRMEEIGVGRFYAVGDRGKFSAIPSTVPESLRIVSCYCGSGVENIAGCCEN